MRKAEGRVLLGVGMLKTFSVYINGKASLLHAVLAYEGSCGCAALVLSLWQGPPVFARCVSQHATLLSTEACNKWLRTAHPVYF